MWKVFLMVVVAFKSWKFDFFLTVQDPKGYEGITGPLLCPGRALDVGWLKKGPWCSWEGLLTRNGPCGCWYGSCCGNASGMARKGSWRGKASGMARQGSWCGMAPAIARKGSWCGMVNTRLPLPRHQYYPSRPTNTNKCQSHFPKEKNTNLFILIIKNSIWW